MEDCIVGKHLSERIYVAVGEGIVASSSEFLVGMGHGRYLLSAEVATLFLSRWRSSDPALPLAVKRALPIMRFDRLGFGLLDVDSIAHDRYALLARSGCLAPGPRDPSPSPRDEKAVR